MKRSYVLVGLGSIAAIGLASTAIAGGGSGGQPSASKSSKSEVAQAAAKKVKRGPRGPVGPQGPAGPQGQQGQQGVQGPPGQAGPSAKVQLGASTNPNTTSNVPITVPFDGADVYDPANMHDPAGPNPERVTIPVAGVYLVTAQVVWPNNGTGARLAAIHQSGGGAATQVSQDGATGAATFQSLSDQLHLAAGDYLELHVVQGSGSSLLLLGGGAGGTTMSVTWIAP